MRSIPLAITWEMLHRGCWALFFGFLYAVLLPTILYGSMLQVEGLEMTDPSLRKTHIVLLQISTYAIGASIIGVQWFPSNRAQWFPSRLYTYPIRTSTIVACYMSLAMVFATLEMLFSTALINALVKTDWPLWGPALFTAASLAACQATLWYTEKSSWMLFAMPLVLGGLGYWYQTRFSSSNLMWQDLTITEVATMVSLVIVSYFVGVVGMSRNRCGEHLKSLGIIEWFSRTFDSRSSVGLNFKTPLEAQVWFEWRKKGWCLQAIVIFGLFLLPCLWLDQGGKPKELFEATLGGGGLLAFSGLLVGMIIGNVGSIDSNLEMGHFLGSRPLTNSDFARVIRRVVLKTILIAWTIWAFAVFVVYLILWTTTKAPPFPDWFHWWYFLAILMGCWMVTATVASLSLTGRPILFAQIGVGIMVLYFVMLVLIAFAPSRETILNQVFNGLAVIWAIGFIVGTCWVFVVALRKRLIGLPAMVASVGVWLTLCVIGVFESMQHPVALFPGCVVFVGLAAMTVFPLAAAPLAISWNRTR